jgi:putative intracellular protease/amidase
VFTNEAVCIDGNIITANGPRAAEDFARAILKLVKK